MQIRQCLNGRNERQFRFDRFAPGRVNGRCVHATRVEVANFLFVGAGRGFGARRCFQDFPQILLILVGKLAERAPDRVLRRDRVRFHPSAHGKLIKVVTGFASLVEIGGVEPPRLWLVRPIWRTPQLDARESDGHKADDSKHASCRKKSFGHLSAPVWTKCESRQTPLVKFTPHCELFVRRKKRGLGYPKTADWLRARRLSVVNAEPFRRTRLSHPADSVRTRKRR